jgi:hypothetical protein
VTEELWQRLPKTPEQVRRVVHVALPCARQAPAILGTAYVKPAFTNCLVACLICVRVQCGV